MRFRFEYIGQDSSVIQLNLDKYKVPCLFLLMMVLVTCDSSGNTLPAERVVTNLDDLSISSFARHGFKQVKELDKNYLEGVQEVWFGYYDKRDLEIRIYDSHKAALQLGVKPAREAIDNNKVVFNTSNKYSGYADYLVVGNAVLLCQRELASCLNLTKTMGLLEPF